MEIFGGNKTFQETFTKLSFGNIHKALIWKYLKETKHLKKFKKHSQSSHLEIFGGYKTLDKTFHETFTKLSFGTTFQETFPKLLVEERSADKSYGRQIIRTLDKLYGDKLYGPP